MEPPNSPKSPNKYQDLLYGDLTEVLRQAVYSVHSALGPGYLEKVYENALAHELDIRGIAYKRQEPIEVYYKDVTAGEYIADFIIDEKIIIELKAVSDLDNNHKAQLMNYLKGTRKKLGILVNFGNFKLQFKRIAS